ncbi:MAG: hypothetical protein L6Q33_14710 [Bacteriovoracaceae bacterium]|nr:hypothetical protein [Bacteriovoracaceae bacterium]NUM57952.1 hypothetical protein [Pseudobdellovibrionaceae bacterium]
MNCILAGLITLTTLLAEAKTRLPASEFILPAPKRLLLNEITAHRGNRVKLRENSLSSLLNSMDIGASSVEFDVHLTKDGTPVLYHDYYLNPKDFTVIKRPVLIKDLTLAELKQISFSDNLQTLPGDTTVPTFEEFLLAVKKRESEKLPTIPLHLEIKSEKGFISESAPISILALRISEVIDKINIKTPIIARAFNWDVLTEFKKHKPKIPLVLLVDEKELSLLSAEEVIRKYKPLGISPHHADLTPETIKSWLEHKIQVNPWTVNSIERAQELISMGVTGLTTDNPELFLENFSTTIKKHYCLKNYTTTRKKP